MNPPLRLLTLAAVLSASTFGSTIVYSNTTNDTGTSNGFTGNGATELGDRIALIGTDRTAVLATVQFYNNSATPGTFDTTLRLFNVGAPVGSQIGSGVTVSGVSAPSFESFNVIFVVPSLLVPDNLIFTVSADNQSGGMVLGVNLFDPPTSGSSLNTTSIAKVGGNYATLVAVSGQNVFFELEAVPEPAMIGLVGSALAGLVLFRRRRVA